MSLLQDAATQAFYHECFQPIQRRPRDRQRETQMPIAVAGFANLRQGPQVAPAPRAWTQSVSSGNKEWLLSGRVDYNLDENDKIFGRVKFDRGTSADLHRLDQSCVRRLQHSTSG